MAGKESVSMFRAPVLYREWGLRFNKIENYDMAIDAFEKSMREAGTDDLRTLLGLCQALTNFTRYQEASDVALKCSKIDPQNFLVKWMWVKTLFKIGEFGKSLVHAHRGYRKKKLPFEWAIYQANETIEDCVGRNTSPNVLVELYPWIKRLEDHRRNLIAKLNEEVDEFEGIDDDHSRFKINDADYKLEVHLRKLDRALASRYLGTLAVDKHFVESILDDPSLGSTNIAGGRAMRELAKACVKRTSYRQEVLRTRKPLYHFGSSRNKRTASESSDLATKRAKRNNVTIYADIFLRRLHEARKNRDYALFFRLVDRAKDKFDKWQKNVFPMRESCLRVLYEMIGWTYVDSRDVTNIADPDVKLRHLKHHLGIRIAELPRDSDLAWIPTTNGKRSLATFRKRLALASQPLELAWLFHELAKYFVETGRYDMARFYAKKSRDSSYEARNDPWTLNAHHLMIRIEIHQNNRNEAREAAVLAYLGARRLGSPCCLDFYRRLVKLVDSLDLTTVLGIDSVTARERLIVDLMPEELKNEMNFLIRNMRSVPAARRFTVMPGCKPVDHELNFASKRNTILPAPPRDPSREARRALLEQYAPSKDVLGWIDFEDYE